MSRRPVAVLAASPTLVGAVTVLIAIVAVFLAYNANNGLPFVPTYRVSVEVPNSARLRDSNEIRIGGTRVGAVESIEPAVDADQQLAQVDPETGELPPIVARINLKLDKSAEPLPQDSIFRVRYRSPFGLKYLEVVRGAGPPAPEGFLFDGTDDGAICSLPTDVETFSEEIPEQATNGCFQAQTEFDAINDTFDNKTRKSQRQNLFGYGNAFASRGQSLNDVIAELRPLFTNLRPVARILADPETNLGRFFRGLARTAQYTAPAAVDQAEQFVNAAIAFRAISSDPEALKEAISEAPLTYETGIRLLPAQRAFLARVETFARAMRPSVENLRVTLPVLNDTIEIGAPVLRDQPPVNRRLREVLLELEELVRQPSTRLTLMRLNETFPLARSLARYVVPAQTVCNLFNYWFTFFPQALTDRDASGYGLRQMLTRYPGAPVVETPIGGYSGIGANAKAGTASPTPGQFRPYEFPLVNTHPYGPTGQRNADCQPGQIGYPLGRGLVPGQPLSNPGNRQSDLPGSRGPLTLFYDAAGEKTLFDSRIASRQPETWRRARP